MAIRIEPHNVECKGRKKSEDVKVVDCIFLSFISSDVAFRTEDHRSSIGNCEIGDA